MIRKIFSVLSFFNQLFWQIAGFILAAFYLLYRFFLPHREGSHPASKFFRKVFEGKKARTSWGITLLGFIFMANFYLNPFSGRPPLEQNIALAAAPKNILTTETAYQKPTQGWLSQGFHWYHPAVDIATNFGENVYPIAEGKVITVEHTKWGYGHFVVIDHERGYKSLYAHLGEIKVQPGQKVDKLTLLGYVAMTGWTTGPHLHLEIYEKEGNLNPAEVVPGVLPQMAYRK
jgi:murein DD-endopeptidase MepM/ murein hydrolase activator NlpD